MTSQGIRTAVIPAAGRGTRSYPATRVVPKALLPVAGKPLIQYAVDEAAASGIETVVLVLAPEMNIVAEHFRVGRNGQSNCGDIHLTRLAESVEIRQVVQRSPRGLADAVACARPLTCDEPFVVILPDVLIDSPVPATAQLLLSYGRHRGCTIATQLIRESEIDGFGILIPSSHDPRDEVHRTFRIGSLLEKPRASQTASRYGAIGRYMLMPDIFAFIDELQPGRDNELQLSDALSLCAQRTPTYACVVDGGHYDAGSMLGYLQAYLAYSFKDPEIEQPLRRHLATLFTSSATASKSS